MRWSSTTAHVPLGLYPHQPLRIIDGSNRGVASGSGPATKPKRASHVSGTEITDEVVLVGENHFGGPLSEMSYAGAEHSGDDQAIMAPARESRPVAVLDVLDRWRGES